LGFLLCLFYSVIFAGQVLGFLGLYNLWTALPLALAVFGVSGYFYFKSLDHAHRRAEPAVVEMENRRGTAPAGAERGAAALSKLDLLFGLCAVALTVALIAVPLLLWPASPAGKTLTWDAGLFQFPKAIELFRSGSIWNMNVCYAEYPLGYESLLSFSLLFGGNTAFFGFVHFVLALFLIAALWLLAKRATDLPSGLLLLGVVLLLLYGFINKDTNPWWIYEPLLFTVGKNDLFQGAAVLAVLVYAPVLAARDEKSRWNPVGFALASMVAFSIKPNSLIILPLWLLAFYYLWKESADIVPVGYGAEKKRNDFFKKALLMIAVALPGLLWIFRNLAALGALFTQQSLKLGTWSIAANLTNPNLYRYIPVYLYFFLTLTGLAVILAVFRKRITLPAALTLTALLVGFAVTPASAFHGSTTGRAEIAWRFALAFISYALLLLLVIVSPLFRKLIDAAGRYRLVWLALAIGALALSGFFFWRMRPLVRSIPENAVILRDQFEQPVGVDGYTSAYDYVRRNIHNSSIIVDNGLPFYAYDAAFTNTTACSGHADYFIVFNTDWDKVKPGEYPEYVRTTGWKNDWDVVYEDGYSRVYKRR